MSLIMSNYHYGIVLFLILWTGIVYSTIQYTNITLELLWIILFLCNYTGREINYLIGSLYYCLLYWWHLGWQYYLLVLPLIFFLLCLVYKIIGNFICDTFKVIYHIFPDSREVVGLFIGFTTFKEFKMLYSLENLNWYYFVTFVMSLCFFAYIDLQPIFLNFFLIIALESHIILYLVYEKNFLCQ